MRRVFADSFFYIALANPADESHRRALEFSADYPGGIVITAWVLTEVADAFASPPLRQLFLRLMADLRDDPKTAVAGASMKLFERGVEHYSQRLDKSWSLTDCISFEVMREKGLREALTGDRHFEQAGFKALLKP